MVKSNYLKTIILVAIILTVVIVLVESGSRSAPKLSEEIAPDVSPETFEAFADRSDIYVLGSGQKDVLLVADVFCSYSRKAYNLLIDRLEYIKRIRILLVSRFPENGSDEIAAFVMRMHTLGEGRETLESALKWKSLMKKTRRLRNKRLWRYLEWRYLKMLSLKVLNSWM